MELSGKLSEEQVKDFDVEYVTPKAWEVLSRQIDQFGLVRRFGH